MKLIFFIFWIIKISKFHAKGKLSFNYTQCEEFCGGFNAKLTSCHSKSQHNYLIGMMTGNTWIGINSINKGIRSKISSEDHQIRLI